MDEGNLPILVDAKTEYTKQLINIISPVIYQGVKLIYNESKNRSIENEEINSDEIDLEASEDNSTANNQELNQEESLLK